MGLAEGAAKCSSTRLQGDQEAPRKITSPPGPMCVTCREGDPYNEPGVQVYVVQGSVELDDRRIRPTASADLSGTAATYDDKIAIVYQ